MTIKSISQSKRSNLPTEKWQSTANEFVTRCGEFLWAKDGTQVRKYLHSLGLHDETLRKNRIGYNPKVEFGSLKAWGLPEEYNSKGNLSKVWLPPGVVVPCHIENTIRSIKIRRYLTQEQKSRDEQSDHSIKGSMPGLFGTQSLRHSLCAVLTDNEFDAMFLDQCAGDLVGVASFGRDVKGVGASDWVMWGQYLLSVSDILVLYKANEEEKKIIADSLPVYSCRTHRAYLPDIPSLQFVSDFKKLGVDPREWLKQTMSSLGILEEVTNHKLGVSRASGINTPEILMDVVTTEVSNHTVEKVFTEDFIPTTKWVIVDLNERRLVDAKMMPATQCHSCYSDEYWQRSDGGWVCSTCHPNPKRLSQAQADGHIC